jgi:hypothetical protein
VGRKGVNRKTHIGKDDEDTKKGERKAVENSYKTKPNNTNMKFCPSTAAEITN